MKGDFQNNIKDLPQLNSTRYENIFKVYKEKDYYYYNLIQSIYLPSVIDDEKVFYMVISNRMPWTSISYNAYKTIDLWWLICLANNVFNPVEFAKAGTSIKIIKSIYVNDIIRDIRTFLATK